MITRKPTPEDLPILSRLWQEAFGDSPEDVENFYKTAFSCERALLAEAQKPVGGIYWIDAQIGGQKVAYLYALAVEKTCRGQGIGKTLLKSTLATLKGEGYAGAVLVPGEKSLYAYYQKAGFVPFGKTQKTPVQKKAPGLPGKEVSPAAYFALRQKATPSVVWGEAALSYLGTFCRLYEGKDWLLAIGEDGVQEFVGNAEKLPHVLYTLNIEQAQALLPGENPCAMAYCFVPIALPEVFGPSF